MTYFGWLPRPLKGDSRGGCILQPLGSISLLCAVLIYPLVASGVDSGQEFPSVQVPARFSSGELSSPVAIRLAQADVFSALEELSSDSGPNGAAVAVPQGAQAHDGPVEGGNASDPLDENDQEVPEKPRIAVFEFDVRGDLGIRDAGAIINEWMITSLAQTNQFTLTERALLKKIQEEQQLQSSYLADNSEMAAEAGKLLGVEAIVTGTVSKFGNTISIVARLIDASTGVIRATAQATTHSPDDILDQIGLLARQLAGIKPVEAVPVVQTSPNPPPPPPVQQPPQAVQQEAPQDSPQDSPESDHEALGDLIETPGWLSVRIYPENHLRLGDEMRLEVSSERSGDLLIFDVDTTGQVAQIFPYPCDEPCADDHRIHPGEPIVIPELYDGIQFAAQEPIGQGRIVAVLAAMPLTVDDLLIDEGQPPDGSSSGAPHGFGVRLKPSARDRLGSRPGPWAAEAVYLIER